MVIEAPGRMPWDEVPESIRASVGEILGAPIVTARTQTGGFSPGSADRVVTATGRRAFVKTASRAVNAEATEIHRLEARKSASLPAGIPAPRMLGIVDRGDWVAVVFDDIVRSTTDYDSAVSAASRVRRHAMPNTGWRAILPRGSMRPKARADPARLSAQTRRSRRCSGWAVRPLSPPAGGRRDWIGCPCIKLPVCEAQ